MWKPAVICPSLRAHWTELLNRSPASNTILSLSTHPHTTWQAGCSDVNRNSTTIPSLPNSSVSHHLMDMTISHFLWLEAGERQLLDKIGHSDVNLKNRNSTTTIRPSNPPSQPPPPRGTNSINVVPPSFRYTTLNLFIRLHHSSFLSHLVFFFFAKIDGARIKSYFGNCDSQLQPRGIPTILQPLSPPSLQIRVSHWLYITWL